MHSPRGLNREGSSGKARQVGLLSIYHCSYCSTVRMHDEPLIITRHIHQVCSMLGLPLL